MGLSGRDRRLARHDEGRDRVVAQVRLAVLHPGLHGDDLGVQAQQFQRLFRVQRRHSDKRHQSIGALILGDQLLELVLGYDVAGTATPRKGSSMATGMAVCGGCTPNASPQVGRLVRSRGDAAVDYQKIMTVIDELKKRGLSKLGLPTQNER